jgi:CRISPR-associated protein Csx10
MTTPLLNVTVTALQPLSLGTTAEVSFYTGSHDFVPGSVLRGALAAAWIAENGPPDAVDPASAELFRALFDGDIRFGPLYPAGCQRIPVSVLYCKYPQSDACSAVVDRAFEDGTVCPGCRRRREASKGDLCLPKDIRLGRVVRTSIDKKTMRAKDGELYGQGALPAGTTLTGTVFGRHEWLEQPRTLRLGGRRTVGGSAEYTVTASDAPPSPPPGTSLVIRLTSPAVFVDTAGRSRLEPDLTLDLGAGIELAGAWARPVIWSGWHAASRLPKPSEVCAIPGSTYSLASPGRYSMMVWVCGVARVSAPPRS